MRSVCAAGRVLVDIVCFLKAEISNLHGGGRAAGDLGPFSENVPADPLALESGGS